MKTRLLIVFCSILLITSCSIKDKLPLESTPQPKERVLTSITVLGPTTVVTNQQAQYTATGKDQFGDSMSITPDWSVTGGIGVISATGLLTAAPTNCSGRVIATSGSVSGYLDVSIVTGTFVYGIFSEDSSIVNKLKLSVANPPDPDGGGILFWEAPSLWGGGGLTADAYEGIEAIYFTFGQYGDTGWAGFNIQFGCSGEGVGHDYNGWHQNGPALGTEIEKDLSIYSGGKLTFWIKTTNECMIEMEGPKNTKVGFRLVQDLGKSLSPSYQYVEIPLANFVAGGVNLSQIVCPFKLILDRTYSGENGGTLYVDDIRFVK